MFSRLFSRSKRPFLSLSEQEILALAISSEEDDGRIYLAYADALRAQYPHSAKVFEEMAEEESHHRQWLIDLHVQRFGNRIPLIRREHVRDFPERKPDWLIAEMPIEKAREEAEAMEEAAHRFYVEAATRTQDAATRNCSAISRSPKSRMNRSPVGLAKSIRLRTCAPRRTRPRAASSFSLTFSPVSPA